MRGFLFFAFQTRFNTQPPEGGWGHRVIGRVFVKVSTHSRLKAAGEPSEVSPSDSMFQHTAA